MTGDDSANAFAAALDDFIQQWRSRVDFVTAPPAEEMEAFGQNATRPRYAKAYAEINVGARERTLEYVFELLERARAELKNVTGRAHPVQTPVIPRDRKSAD